MWSPTSRASRRIVWPGVFGIAARRSVAGSATRSWSAARSARKASIVAALGYGGDPETLPILFPYSLHSAAEVRLAVAFSVATVSPQPINAEARTALIRLSEDCDSEVRDWATFGLGRL